MTDYPARSVKQDPETGIVAVRTTFSDPLKAWQVLRPDGVRHYVELVDVETWTDLVPDGGS